MSKKDQFIKEFKPLIDNFLQIIWDNKRHQKENVKGFTVSGFQYDIIITIDQLTSFNDLVTKLTYYQDFEGNFSEKYVEKEFLNLLHKLRNDYSQADESIEKFYTSFIDNSNNEWRVIAQLENVIFVERAVFKLIDCTLKHMKLDDLIDCTLKLMKPDELSISGSSLQQEVLGPHYSNWVLSHCIYTDVKAGDLSKAEELAIDNFNLSINLLRLYFPNLKINIKNPVSLSDKQETIVYELISTNVTKKCANVSGKKDIDQQQKLNPKVYEYLVKNGINNLSNNNQINCEFKISDVVKDCLYWYGLALDTNLLSAKLLNYVTVLESALKFNDRNELTQRIADRCALFLETDYKKRKDICTNVKEIYKLRSAVVHSGSIIGKKFNKKFEQLKLIELAGIYARNVLIKLIRENDQRNGDFKKFIQDLDDIKYKEKFYVLTIRDSV